MRMIDDILDRTTMYRVVLYYLLFLLGAASALGFFGLLPYSPLQIIVSSLFLVVLCWVVNKLFARVYHAPTNVESVYISALILVLILPPMKSFADVPLTFWAGVLAMASKYIVAINRKHIFNPVALAVVLTSFGFGGSASWWVGTAAMLPFTLLGLLIVRKIRRYDLVFYFFIATLVTMLGSSLMQGSNIIQTLKQILLSSPIFFFAFVMLTEPLTTPPTKTLQAIYGALVGVLYAPQFHIGSFYTTPELALVIGNIFAYIISPKEKWFLILKEKVQSGSDTMDFLFTPPHKLAFAPGQYMEWTLQHKRTDSRGNRRYFTIASSPTEDTLRLGVKFYPHSSSFKKALANLDRSTQIVGSQLSGDFTLPKNKEQKLAFLAGGIGITPFRSMLKYLVDTHQPRDIVLFYSNRNSDEIVYQDVLAEANTIGIRTVLTLTNTSQIPADWKGLRGRVDETMIRQEVPDYMQRVFYLSGSHSFVTTSQALLRRLGIAEKNIKIDFFPGFA